MLELAIVLLSRSVYTTSEHPPTPPFLYHHDHIALDLILLARQYSSKVGGQCYIFHHKTKLSKALNTYIESR